MAYLADTNVLSELGKPVSNPTVVAWLLAKPLDEIFVSAVTIAEIQWGGERLPPGRRRDRLSTWWNELINLEYADRVVPFGKAEGRVCGRLMADIRRAGRSPTMPDCMIAATAVVRNFTLATRNVADFQDCGVDVLNPWAA